MVSTRFTIRDPAIRPRIGVPVVLDHFGRQTPGTVCSFVGSHLQVEPTAGLLADLLRTGSRLKVTFLSQRGPVEATVGLISVLDGRLNLQIVGQPIAVQRRAEPRARVRLGAIMTWLDPYQLTVHAVEGLTENLSAGGALVRFDTDHELLPTDETAVLVGLMLDAGPAAVPGRVLQAWDGAARVRFLEVHPQIRAVVRGLLRDDGPALASPAPV